MHANCKTCLKVSASAIGLCCVSIFAVSLAAPSEAPAKYRYDPNWPKPLQVVQKIGRFGREGGAFSFLHVATMDSKGNLYTGEVATGRRVQKFSPAQ